MGNNGFRLTIPVEIDKTGVGKSIIDAFLSAQKEADSKKIKFGTELQSSLSKDIGKELMAFTKNLKPIQLDKLFKDEKIKNSILETIDQIDKLDEKIKELERNKSTPIKFDKEFVSGEITKAFNDVYDDIKDENDDLKFDSKAKTAAKKLFKNINQIIKESGNPEEVKKLIKGDDQWDYDLTELGEEFKLKLDFTPVKKDNSELEKLVKERDELFDRLTGKYMEWSGINLNEILNKMSGEVELVPKLSDNFKADAEALVNGLNLEASVNLLGKIDEENFVDFESLSRVLENITKTFSSMQEDGKFSLNLIDKKEIEELKGHVKALNEFADLLKIPKMEKVQVSNGKLLQAFVEENERQDIFGTFERIKNNKDYDERSGGMFFVENPNTGEIYDSYNGLIDLLKELANEYEIAGDKAENFNLFISSASRGMRYYEDLEVAWANLAEHIVDTTGKSIYGAPSYYKEVEKTSTVFHEISESLKNATIIISDSLTDIVEQLELINKKDFNITIGSMNNLNDATSKTIDNVLKLGTVLKLIAEADVINRELLIEDPVEKSTKDKRVTKERGLIYSSKTGKLSNPFTWDHDGSVHWDTYEKLGFKLYDKNQDWDTMIHSHSGDDIVIPSMSQGDMAVAIQRYLQEDIKNHIIVATDEIMTLDMDIVKEIFKKQYGFLNNFDFKNKWFEFVSAMEGETRTSKNEYAMSRMNANELDYYARHRKLNMYKEKYDPFDESLGEGQLKSKLRAELSNLGYGSEIDNAYKTLMSILEKFNGKKMDPDLQNKIKEKTISKFTKMFGSDGEFLVEGFWVNYFQDLMDSFIDSTKYFYTNDANIKKGGAEGKEARARRNYWLQLIRPGLNDAIEQYGLQDAFHFYTPSEFEKQSKFKINLGDGDLNLEDDEETLMTTEEILKEILQLLKDIGEEGKLSFNFDSSGLNNIKQNLDDIKNGFVELLNFINKLSNFNLNKMDNPIRANPLSLFVKNTDVSDVFESIFPENENGENEFNLSKAFSMKDIGKSHTEINKKLREYFNGYGVEYSSIISYLESLSEILDIKNILNTDSLIKFENAMNYLKNNSDIMNKNFFSQKDLENIEIASKQLDEIIYPMFGKQSFLDLIENILPQTYESVQSTIFDSILNSIKNLQTTGLPVGNLNIDSLEIDSEDIKNIIREIDNKNKKFEDEEKIVKTTTENEKGYLEQLANAIRQFASDAETVLKDIDFSILSTKIDAVIKEISEKKIELNFDIENLDDEKISKLNEILNNLKRNIFGNENGSLNIDLLSSIINNADFKNIDTEKLQIIAKALKDLIDVSGSSLAEENSFIPKLHTQLENILKLSSQLEIFAKLIKELKESADIIDNIPDVIPDDGSGGKSKSKEKKKVVKKKDDSPIGKQLSEYEQSIYSYYSTLNKIARGTATRKDVVLNETAYQEMVRLQNELANNTSKTNEQQQRFNELLSKSKALMDDLNNNSQDIARLLFNNSGFDVNSSAFSHIEERYNNLFGKINQVGDYDSLKRFKEELGSLSQDYQAFEKLYSKFGRVETFGSYSEAISKIKQDALDYGRIIKETGDVQPDGSGMAKYTITVKAATGETKQLAIQWNEAIKSMGVSEKYLGEQRRFGILGFFDNVKKKIYDVTSYLAGVYLSPMDWIRYIREGINYVKEMDTALTEMRKVSDESLESLKRYQLTTFDTAQRIGTTATELQKSTADWMRLGESLDEAAKSAETTAILANVSEFESIDDATKALVATSQAYKDLDKMTIVDKLNEIGNNYSISTDELATGLQRSSATLSLMGNTIDEAAALITAGNATIQNAESVAAGIRVISLRLVGTKEAKEQLKVDGEDIEDAFIQMTEAKKQQIIKDYTAVASNNYQGFDILDENGNYKNTYEILLGISKVYKEIQEEDKKYGTNRANALIEELAGKVRSNIVSAVLQNGSMLESVKASSESASGSAMRENEKYLDSVEGRIKQLTTGLEEFWNKAINSEDLKVIIQFLTNMLEIVNNIVERLGTLPALLSTLSPLLLNKTGLSLFNYGVLKDEEGHAITKDGKKQYGFQGLFHDLFAKNNIADELNEIADAEENVINRSSGMGRSLSGLSSVFSSLGNLGKALVASLAEIAITMAVFWAAGKIISVIDKAINGDKQIIENGKRATESITETYDTYNKKVKSLKSASEILSEDGKVFDSNSEALDNLSKKYTELSNGVSSFDNSNISLTNEEYQTFLDTSNQIAEILPSLVNKYDENGNAMLALGNNAEEASVKIKEALESQQLLSHYEIMGNTVDQMKGIAEQNRLYNKDKSMQNVTIQEIEEKIRAWEEGRVAYTYTEEERVNALSELYGQLAQEKEKNNTIDQMISENYKAFIPTLQNLLQTDSSFTNLDSTIQDKLINNIGNIPSESVKKIIDNADGDSIKLMTYLDKVFVDPYEYLERQGLTDKLVGLFDFDSSKLSFNEYLITIDDELNALFPDDKSQVNMWRGILGVDDLVSQSRKITEILSDTSDKIDLTKKQFDTLTMEDRKIAYDLIVNNKFEGTFKELKEKIEETKNQLNEKDLFATPLLDSYNKAVEDADNPGKNYDQYAAAFKSLKEQYDKGLIGTDTFKKGAKMFSVGGATDADNFIENYERMKKYFNEDKPMKGLKKFVEDMTKLDLMEKTKEGGYKTKFEDIAEAAKKAKMPVELFISMFDKIEEFGGYNDFFATAEDGFSTVGELTGELAIAQAELQKLEDTQPKNKSAIKAKEEEVKSLQNRLKDAQDQLLKFLNGDGLKDYTENYKKQTQAAQDALNRLNKNENYKNADDDQKQIMLEAIRAGFKDSGLDSSIYKGLGINKNGKIVLDVQASNERIDDVIGLYKTGKYDQKLDRYNNRTVKEVVEQWAKDAGVTLDEYLGRNNPTDFGVKDKQGADTLGEIDKDGHLIANTDSLDANTRATKELIDVMLGKDKPEREVNGEIDLTKRPLVPSGVLKQKGYEDAGDGELATVFTSTYEDSNGKQFVVTPILPDGTVLSEEDLDKYVNKIVNGGEDDKHLVIATFDGVQAAHEAEAYAQSLHKVHEAYYLGDKAQQEALHSLEDYTAEELRAIDLTDDSTSEIEDSFVSLMKSLGITGEEVQQFINVLEDMGLLRIKPQVDLSEINSVDKLNSTISGQLNVGQSMKYTAEVDGVEQEIKALEEVDGKIKYTVTDKDGTEKEVKPLLNKEGKIVYKSEDKTDKENGDKNKKKKKNGKKETIVTETEVDKTGFEKGKTDVEHGVNALSKETAKPEVSLQGVINANSQINNLRNNINNLQKKKTITIETIKRTITEHKRKNTTKKEGGIEKYESFNGTFHTSSAYARGTISSNNVSIPKDETALINEVGKEIVVRGGKALTFNNGYPVYANLKRGDVVFNHKQTEELERKGYVTGSHAKIFGTPAFVNGTVDDEDEIEVLSNAYYGDAGWNVPKIKPSTTTSKKKNTGKKPNTSTKNTSTKKKNNNKKGKSQWEKFEDKLSQLFDWIEVRLDRLSEKTERWGNLFEKFIDTAGGNAQSAYKAAISAAKGEQKYTTLASNKYLSEALDIGLEGAQKAGTKKVKVGKGKKAKTKSVRNVSDKWVKDIYQKLLSDSLSDRTIAQYGEKKKAIIDAMQGYIDKAKDAAKATVELTDSINDLIKSQRDKNVEFKRSAYSAVVESDNRYGAASKNSALERSTSLSNYAIGEFDNAVTSGSKYLTKLGDDAENTGEIKRTTKKVKKKVKVGKGKKAKTKTVTVNKEVAANASTKIYDSLSKKNKDKYKKYLKTANTCMDKQNIIPDEVIDFFEKYNPSLAGKYEAYNMQVANLEMLRQEAADNYAENIKTIMSNISESYANLDEDTENAISLIEAQAANMGNSTDANKKLNELRRKQDKIITDDKAEINKYKTLIDTYAKGTTEGYKTSKYSNATNTTKGKVDEVVKKARDITKSKKSKIPDSLMMTIYSYYVKGYIKAGFYESCLAYNLAFDSHEQAKAQLEIDEETRKQQALDLYDKKASNIKSHYDTKVSEIEARKNSVSGNYKDTSTQQKVINQRTQEIKDLQDILKEAVKKGDIVEGTDQWLERVVEIQEKTNSLNDLKLEHFETEIEEKFERAIQKADQLIEKYDTIKGLIDDEMLYDKKSGKLTEMGWLSVGLDSKSLAEEKNNLKRYLSERNEIIDEYNNGNTDYFGDESFDEKIQDVDKKILDSFSNMKSYNDELISIMEGQAEAELEALQKVIDKRKEALQKKKDYYDYDKTIKGKTKDLQSLEQQIRALEGVAGQEAAAKRANLMAQRKEAQEDLDDTVKEHIYNMQIEGLDTMMSNLQENLDDWKKDLHGDLEAQQNAIKELTAAYNSEKIPFDITVTALLNGTSGEKAITQKQVSGVVSKDGSKTLNQSGDTKKDTRTGDISILTTTKKVTTTAKKVTTTTKKPTTTTKKPTTTTKKKVTVTDDRAMLAYKYLIKNLVHTDKEGKNWGKLNKTLWRKKDYNRQVYLPQGVEKMAWHYLTGKSGDSNDYSNTALLDILKKTGIWDQLLKVRWDPKNKKIITSGLDAKKIHGYASGGIVHRSGRYLTDEKGEEIIVTKQGILRPLSAGTSIIPADITERLYALASNYDMGANARAHSIDVSKIQRLGGETISPIINCPITIEGNANEQDVINAINKTLPKISKHVQNDIRKDLRKSGR